MNSKKYNSKKKQEKVSAKEPSAEYSSKRITFFNSIEEMNEDTHRSYANLTPEQCISFVTLMRLNAYPFLNIELNPWGYKIYFD
jgi:hypothetical protein